MWNECCRSLEHLRDLSSWSRSLALLKPEQARRYCMMTYGVLRERKAAHD